MSVLCRDCFTLVEEAPARRCPACRSPRLVRHEEIATLAMAHIDCDAFYATVEKRDNPALADKPVIIGGGKRGVVSAACYVARTFGVKSAMPMFKALAACPNAVVIRPDMQKYAGVGREVRQLMLETTPLVEPLSLDEAFLDLSGTERLHKCSPAQTLARLARRIEDELRITVSVGLSFNKFLAKVASDLDKPRGFSVVGRAEAVAFLDKRPVTLLPGVGKAFGASLARDGIFTIGDVRRRSPKELGAHFGASGLWLWRLSNADDTRTVEPRSPAKGISAETTFEHDVADREQLARILWALCEKVSARAKAAEIGGNVIQLKLKTADFKLVTRRHTLEKPTQLARRLFETAHDLLEAEATGRRYRLIGVGIADLVPAEKCDGTDLFDQSGARRDAAERAMDKVREKFGARAIRKGRSL
ncbi:MAG: DNA polymerase IV [Alphaproteobacteria bacterium]|nr:DNA polymerase IV [Alphaproteobacteria bacterium]